MDNPHSLGAQVAQFNRDGSPIPGRASPNDGGGASWSTDVLHSPGEHFSSPSSTHPFSSPIPVYRSCSGPASSHGSTSPHGSGAASWYGSPRSAGGIGPGSWQGSPFAAPNAGAASSSWHGSPRCAAGPAAAPPRGTASWRNKYVLNAKAAAPKMRLISGQGADDGAAQLVALACAALDAGAAPSLVDDGMGGAYFLKEPRSAACIAVFKPRDEEPGAYNNPKPSPEASPGRGLGEGGFKGGILVGEAALNECAAYALDATERAAHFSRVPTTTAVRRRRRRP